MSIFRTDDVLSRFLGTRPLGTRWAGPVSSPADLTSRVVVVRDDALAAAALPARPEADLVLAR